MKAKNNNLKLKNITPQKYDCGMAVCPAVFSTNENTYVIIGKKLNKKQAKELLGDRVGKDETVVVVPEGLITGIFEK
jgi:hypothetical protein